MATNRQNAANRRNSKKSTGPKSKIGKENARRNALKHGLTACQLLTPDEKPEEYEDFHENVLQNLKPIGFLEEHKAETITILLWRKRRCPRIEAALLGGGIHVMEEIYATPIEEFQEMLKEKCRPEDMTPSQLLNAAMISRCIAQQVGQSLDKVPFSEISSEQLVEEFLRMREEEHQKNPLTYDISLPFVRDSSKNNSLMKLAKYEAGLDRQLDRALREFQRLQAQRKGGDNAGSMVIDVTDLNRRERKS